MLVLSSLVIGCLGLLSIMKGMNQFGLVLSIVSFNSVIYHTTYNDFFRYIDNILNLLLIIYFMVANGYVPYRAAVGTFILFNAIYLTIKYKGAKSSAYKKEMFYMIHLPAIVGIIMYINDFSHT